MNKKTVTDFLKDLGRDTLTTSWELLKITVPVVIITKILEEMGLIVYLSNYLEPVMSLIGLPGSLGLVWATAILTNPYGAMVIFANLAPGLNLTIAQATIACSIMLIAHSLPVELAITKKAGAAIIPIGILRLAGAFFYGLILNGVCKFFDVWQAPATIIFSSERQAETLLSWGLGQLENFALIIFVIFCILVIMKIFKEIGLLRLFERFLEPILPFLGMSRRAAPVTVVGMVMGIAYGGALIIKETNSGKLGRREVFFSLALMGMSHGLVEDTLLMVALGGHWGGILVGRVIFSLIVIYLLARFGRRPVNDIMNKNNGNHLE